MRRTDSFRARQTLSYRHPVIAASHTVFTRLTSGGKFPGNRSRKYPPPNPRKPPLPILENRRSRPSKTGLIKRCFKKCHIAECNLKKGLYPVFALILTICLQVNSGVPSLLLPGTPLPVLCTLLPVVLPPLLSTSTLDKHGPPDYRSLVFDSFRLYPCW